MHFSPRHSTRFPVGIEHSLNLVGGIGLINAGSNQQLAHLDVIKVQFVSNRLEGRMLLFIIESHSFI